MEKSKTTYNHGTIVSIDYDGTLQDYSTIYIKGGEDLVNKVRVALDSFDRDGCLFDYHVQPINDLPDCSYEQAIALPLYELNRSERRMLVIPVDGTMVDADVATLIHDAEEIASEALHKGMENVAFTNPELLKDLLKNAEADASQSSFSVWNWLPDFSFNMLPDFADAEKVGAAGETLAKKIEKFLGGKSKGDWIDNFVEVCKQNKQNPSYQSQTLIKDVLKNIFDRTSANAMHYLLERMTKEEDYLYFAHNFLDAYAMADSASVNLIVRKITDPKQVNGNDGWIQIFTQKEDKGELLVHFKQKPSFIVYLMYLIDRFNRKDEALSLNLLKNKSSFHDLYNTAYSYSSKDADNEFENLMIRKVDGVLRNGRLPQCINDVRTTLAKIFKEYDENYLPYTLSSRTHLAVPANKIIFEGDAIELTKMPFL